MRLYVLSIFGRQGNRVSTGPDLEGRAPPPAADGEAKPESCAVDIKGDEDQKLWVCRICQLSGKEVEKELIELGCGCKEELGVSHLHCAEAWFRVKGNRSCEICGEIAKSITAVSDGRRRAAESRRDDDGTERRNSSSSSSSPPARFYNERPLCCLILACLVIAFILPWFFRVNMF